MTPTTRLLLAVAMLLACPRPAHSHRLDEYLQATRIALAQERVVLEIDLTPGVTVAPQIFALIDQSGDEQVTGVEIEAYARRVLRDLVLEIDQRPYALTLARAECPSWAEIRDGDGTIRIEAIAEAPLGASGLHRLHYENRHQPATGVYLVNALVPATRAMAITAQRRDVRQHGIDLRIDVAAPVAASWIIVPAVGFTALLVCRRRRRHSSAPTAPGTPPVCSRASVRSPTACR